MSASEAGSVDGVTRLVLHMTHGYEADTKQ